MKGSWVQVDGDVVLDGSADYVVHPNTLGVWVAVDHLTVRIRRQNNEVHVVVYENGNEMGEPLSEFWTTKEEQ